MTEKELFKKETFVELFSKSPFERIEFEDFLFLEAKKLGLEKRFKETLKKYEILFSEKITINNENILPKCKYEIEKFNTGQYICNASGIIDKNNHKFSYIPVFPVERYLNEQTGKEKVKIIFYKENEWKEKIVDKSQLSISQKLLLLSDDGLDVNSENVRYYINYFNEIMNINNINKLASVSHIGWKNNLFIPYDNKGIFDGADEFRNIYKSIEQKGNYEKWQECINKISKNKYIKIIMATTLASPLLEKLNVAPFIVNVWSSASGSGKTLSCMVAMSIWGNPNVGALRLSSNNTQNYYMTMASFMRNFTCFFDELQIVKNNKNFDFEGLIMDLCNGTEKGRLNKNSQAKEVKTWYNNFLFTNNDKMVNENAGEQIYNRVIDLEIRDEIIKDGQDIARIIFNNYGFVGKKFIKYIQEIGFDNIYDRYKKINEKVLTETRATNKQSSLIAMILLADELGNESIFDKNCYKLTLKDLEPYINDKDEIKTAIKAKNYILDIIASNPRKFDASSYSEYWGRKDQFICVINSQILMRELKKGGFEFNTVKKDWAEMDFLRLNSQGRYLHNTSIEGQKGAYIYLNISKND